MSIIFFRLLMDFIDHVKRTSETEQTTWRILEVGIRGENWVKALRYFKDSPLMTDERAEKIECCLREHGEYIIQMHSPYRYISNWGVMENHGLFEIGIQMPDQETRDRFTSIALERLETEAAMQILTTAYSGSNLLCITTRFFTAMRMCSFWQNGMGLLFQNGSATP